MKAATRIKIGLKTALRRRYGYAALRHLRHVVARAIETHVAGLYGERPYNGEAESEALFRGYWSALQKLRKRWPNLDLTDPRAEPEPSGVAKKAGGSEERWDVDGGAPPPAGGSEPGGDR